MGESREQEGFFGKYTEHLDDDGNKIGESRERDGFFGKYTEHTDAHGNKTGESREREGFFGDYTEHTDSSGSKTGESREREGFFGDYTEHVDAQGNKVGESRERDGVFGRYTEHTGSGWLGKSADDTNNTATNSSSGTSTHTSGGGYSHSSSNDSGGILVGLILLVILTALWFGSQTNNESARKIATPYIPSSNVGQRTSANELIFSEETGVVNTPGDGFLALRSEPSANQGSRLFKIPHATSLNIGECVSNSRAEHWCKTTYQGQTGWVLDRYIIKEDKAHMNTSTAEAITLPRGNADRKAILDVIRAEYARPVIFEVLHLKNSGNWAWATVRSKVDGLDHGADCGEEHCPETDIAALQRRHPNAPASIFD